MKSISDKEIELLMDNFERDGDWFEMHKKEFMKKHAGKVIAVKNRKVIGVKRKFTDLIDEIKRMGEDPACVYIEAIPKKGVAYIL
jgi:hypothetical protein